MSEKKSIHDVGEMVGIKRAETDQILAGIRANTALLDGCGLPHDFQPIPQDRPNPFRQKLKCTKCGGEVDLTRGLWYNKGLEDAGKAKR